MKFNPQVSVVSKSTLNSSCSLRVASCSLRQK